MRLFRPVKITITVDVDRDLLCDEQTVREEFGGDWMALVKWLAEEEGGPLFYPVNWPDTTEIVSISDLDC